MEPLVLGGAALAGLALTWPLAQRRLELSLAKHPSLTGHARMARRISRWLPGYAYDEARFFNADDATAEIQQRRRTAFALLVERNDSKDFTGAGVPSVKAVEKLVDFDVDRNEVVALWQAYRAGE